MADDKQIEAQGESIAPQPRKRWNYQTQWAGQFGVARELIRREYLVTFTMGNAPGDDLICVSPSGRLFTIQVKSLSSKTYFLYQLSLLAKNVDRFFVFVYVPQELNRSAEYFVMNNAQFRGVVDEQEEFLRAAEMKRGRPYAAFSPGINYGTIARHDFRDAWRNLPN
jgi:hypothetical protein